MPPSAAKEMIKRKNTQKKIKLTIPDGTFKLAEQRSPRFVDEIAGNLEAQYKPNKHGVTIKGI